MKSVSTISALAFFSIFLTVPLSGYAQDSPAVEIVRSRWFCRWGDSPVDKLGVPTWTYEDVPGSDWKPIDEAQELKPAKPEERRTLWLFTRFPEGNWTQPALLTSSMPGFEVYLGRQRVYRHGTPDSSRINKHWFYKWHNIPLEDDFQRKILFLKVYMSDTGIIGTYGRLWLGSQRQLFEVIIKYGMEFFILGLLACFAGLSSIFVYFRRRKRKLNLALSFGAFAICVGVNYFLRSSIAQLFIRESARYYLSFPAFFLFPVGLHAFIDTTWKVVLFNPQSVKRF